MSAYSIFMISVFSLMWFVVTLFLVYLKFKYADFELKRNSKALEEKGKFNFYYV